MTYLEIFDTMQEAKVIIEKILIYAYTLLNKYRIY